MLLEQGAALTFGHAAPDAELTAVVQSIGAALQNHRTVSADDGGLALGGAAYEKFIGISLATASLRHPCDPGLGLDALNKAMC
jgi:hypothetical protein